MRFKKFLLIPILFYTYVNYIVEILVSSSYVSTTQGISGAGGGMLAIGVGHSVSVSVMRSYFFGLVKLPVYSASIGDIGGFHTAFFYLLGALSVVFIIIEKRKDSGPVKVNKSGFKF